MITSTNIIKDILSESIKRLASLYPEREALAILYWLLEDRYGVRKADLIIDQEKRFSESQIVGFSNDLKKLEKGIPLQYVLGEIEFAGLKLKVKEGSLIPRPETEELIYWAAELLKTVDKPKVLDIGTGTGLIAIALKKLLGDDATVTATDISNDSLELGKTNAALNAAEIEFLNHNILTEELTDFGSFDLIISNPPYIPQSETKIMHKNVLEYEPHHALFVPDNEPLLFYKHIIAKSNSVFKRKGLIMFEIHKDFGKQICELLKENDFESIELRKDLSGHDRMIKAVK